MSQEIPPKMYNSIMLAAATASVVGIPGAFASHSDVPALIGIWVVLLGKLSTQSGRKFDREILVKIATRVLAGTVAFVTGTKVATTLFAWTGVGTLPAIFANASLNGAFTYVFGCATAKVFLNEGIGSDVDAIIASISAIILGSSAPNDSSTKG